MKAEGGSEKGLSTMKHMKSMKGMKGIAALVMLIASVAWGQWTNSPTADPQTGYFNAGAREQDPKFTASAASGITPTDTSSWAAAGVNGAAYTNWAATNNWSTRITDAQATADIATNWQATTTLVRVESDPVWAGVSGAVSVGAAAGSQALAWGNHNTNGYVTGNVVRVESDPVFTNWAATNAYIKAATGATNAVSYSSSTTGSYNATTRVLTLPAVETNDLTAGAYAAFANVPEADDAARSLISGVRSDLLDTDANLMQSAFRIAKLENESEFDLADGYSATFQTATVGTNADRSTYAAWNAGEYYEGLVAGGAGQALFLDGTGDYATNAAAGFTVTNDLTVAWWVRPEESDNDVMWACADLPGNWRGIFAQRNSDESLFFWTSDGSDNMENTWAGVIPQDTWTHLAVVISNSESIIILYTNGVLAEAKSISMLPSQPPAGTPFVVGMYPLGAGANLLGALDQIVAWNRCLTEAEIADVYAGALAANPRLLLEYDGDPDDSSSFASPGELKADATYTNGATTSMTATNMTLALQSYSTLNDASNLVATAFLSGSGYETTNFSIRATANGWTNAATLGLYKATQYKVGEYIVTATGTVANAGKTAAIELITTNKAVIRCHGMMIQTDR